MYKAIKEVEPMANSVLPNLPGYALKEASDRQGMRVGPNRVGAGAILALLAMIAQENPDLSLFHDPGHP